MLAAISIVPACAAPPAADAVLAAHADAAAELSRAWAAEHAMARATLAALLDIRRTTLRGTIHRELLVSGCLVPADPPRADAARLAALLADPAADFALLREVRLGRMTEAQANAWLADYAAALALSDTAANAAVRHAMLDRLAPLESLNASAAHLTDSLSARAERIAALSAEASAAAPALHSALTARASWRTVAADLAAPQSLDAALDALFPNPSDAPRRAAAHELLLRILTPG